MKRSKLCILTIMVAFATGCSGESVPVAGNEEVVATEMQRTPTVTFFSTDDSVVLSEDAPAKEIEDYPYYYKEDYEEQFGDSYLYEDGNLVMCLSMIESYYKRIEITPDMFLINHNDLCEKGTESLNSAKIQQFIEDIGLGCVEADYDLKTASDSLKTLHGCILVYIPHNSVYGVGGSYLLITGISNTEFIVHDPSKESENANIIERRDNQAIYNATTLTAAASKSSKMWIIY